MFFTPYFQHHGLPYGWAWTLSQLIVIVFFELVLAVSVALFAPLGLVMFLSWRIQAMSAATAHITFLVYAGIMGISLARRAGLDVQGVSFPGRFLMRIGAADASEPDGLLLDLERT